MAQLRLITGTVLVTQPEYSSGPIHQIKSVTTPSNSTMQVKHTLGAEPTKTTTFAPANATTTLQVVQDPLPAPIDSYPLPTEYWTRPIEGQNTFWFAISSNWLNAPYIRSGTTVTGGAGYGRYQPDGTAPNSAHVMWTKALQFGGIVGGNDTNIPGETYYMGGSYNVRFSNAIVMQGNIYYQEAYGNGGGGGNYVAVNIRTGKELWRINATATGVLLYLLLAICTLSIQETNMEYCQTAY